MSPSLPHVNGDEQDLDNHDGTNNGHVEDHEDAFQHLSKPQQKILLLHGPQQKYSLETKGQIPDLRSDREILIQVH